MKVQGQTGRLSTLAIRASRPLGTIHLRSMLANPAHNACVLIGPFVAIVLLAIAVAILFKRGVERRRTPRRRPRRGPGPGAAGAVYELLRTYLINPPAFGRRFIPLGVVAPSSNTLSILGRRALPRGRLAALGAAAGL